jgi:hypothetical protein
LHRYLYAYSNPTVYIDPDGHAVTLPPLSEDNKTGYVEKGYLYTQYESAQREWQNPNNSIPVRAAYLGLATATAPVALPEEHIVRPLLNAPNTVYNSGVKIGEHAARAKFKYEDKDYAGAFEEALHVTANASEGFVAGAAIVDPLVE